MCPADDTGGCWGSGSDVGVDEGGIEVVVGGGGGGGSGCGWHVPLSSYNFWCSIVRGGEGLSIQNELPFQRAGITHFPTMQLLLQYVLLLPLVPFAFLPPLYLDSQECFDRLMRPQGAAAPTDGDDRGGGWRGRATTGAARGGSKWISPPLSPPPPLLPRGPQAAGYKNCGSLHQMRCFALLLLLLPHCGGDDEAPPPVHPSSLPLGSASIWFEGGRAAPARRGGPSEEELAKRPFAAPSAVSAHPAGRSDAAAQRRSRSARRRSWKTH